MTTYNQISINTPYLMFVYTFDNKLSLDEFLNNIKISYYN